MSFGSVLLLLARRRDISPGVSLARGRAAIQSMVPPSFTAPLGAYSDCIFILFFFTLSLSSIRGYHGCEQAKLIAIRNLWKPVLEFFAGSRHSRHIAYRISCSAIVSCLKENFGTALWIDHGAEEIPQSVESL